MSEFSGWESWVDPTQNSDTGIEALDGDGAAATAYDVATFSPAAATYTILSGSETDNEVTEATEQGAQQAADAATDAYGDYLDWLPWYVPYATAGVALLIVLVVLAPYAEVGAEVAG
jgi:hypothetical protein